MKFKEALKKSVELFDSKEFIELRREEDPTMIKHLPLLQKINKLGFLTENSQAGRFSKGKHYKDGLPYEIHERAYVSGFMLETKAVEFIKHFNLYTDKNVAFVPVCSDTIHLPASLDIPVTYSIHKKITSIDTHMSTALPNSLFEWYKKFLKINKSEKVVYLFCWDTKWDRLASKENGLFKDIIKTLSKLP
jgi:hypothetical protein